jgi:hypothetical protein
METACQRPLLDPVPLGGAPVPVLFHIGDFPAGYVPCRTPQNHVCPSRETGPRAVGTNPRLAQIQLRRQADSTGAAIDGVLRDQISSKQNDEMQAVAAALMRRLAAWTRRRRRTDGVAQQVGQFVRVAFE